MLRIQRYIVRKGDTLIYRYRLVEERKEVTYEPVVKIRTRGRRTKKEVKVYPGVLFVQWGSF